MSNSVLQEVNLRDVEFNNTNLIASQIMDTSLNNIDLSSCDITGIAITPQSLKGVIVSELQAVELSRLLGIVVK